jgi:hypothetical protein
VVGVGFGPSVGPRVRRGPARAKLLLPEVPMSGPDNNPGLDAGRPAIWLVRDTGARLRVPARGLILGRRADCDVVLQDKRASQHHAMLTPTLHGLEVIALGRNPTKVDGRAVDRQAVVKHGQAVEVPGGLFMVHAPNERRGALAPAWVATHPDGNVYGVRQLPYSIGGGPEDDLQVRGWPPGALCFYGVQGAMAVEVGGAVALNGDELEVGAVEVVEPGDVFSAGGVEVRVDDARARDGESTDMRARSPHPIEVLFEFLPNGGRLHLHFDDGEKMVVELAELRARLVAALLTPSGGYEAGEYIPDEVLLTSIWPGNTSRGRTDLNVLIHRTRKSLMKSGINPSAVIARARQGRATSVRLAPGAKVTVR